MAYRPTLHCTIEGAVDVEHSGWKETMRQTLRLVRSGRVHEATQLIRRSIRGASTAPRGFDSRSQDVQTARTVPESSLLLPSPLARAPHGRPERAPPLHRRAPAPLRHRLFVPDTGYGARPLLVMLHGCKQDPTDFARGTRMDHAAGARGWYVLYPEQSQRANGARCWNWFDPRNHSVGRGEAAALMTMIDEIVAAHPVDASRVYVAGLSAGAAMAVLLAANHPERFAAVAAHSGLPYGAATSVPEAFTAMRDGGDAPALPRTGYVPLLAIHGDADPTVSPRNTERLVAQWRAWGGEDGWTHSVFADGQAGRAYRRERWSRADGSPVLEHWRVAGLGHAWSGGDPQGSYADPIGVDASAVVLAFFDAIRE